MTPADRRGFSLVEMIIALVISVGMGAAIVSLLSTSLKFSERNEAQRAARPTARSAISALVNDLRPVDPSWGVDAASTQSVQVKSPYAIGIVCDTTAKVTLAILPVDSTTFAVRGYSGFAWRSGSGVYTAVPGGAVSQLSAAPTSCTVAGIQTFVAPPRIPNQRTLFVTIGGTARSGIKIGSVVMLYRRARFYFAASGQAGLTGRTALWRDYLDDGAANAELAAPFDSNAAFAFYVSGAGSPQGTAPTVLSTMRGIQLRLPGESDNVPRQRTSPEQADVITAVFFLNVAS
jgi:prepilin-type N-terminal cleavage/methylation domain-containing protein